MLLCCKHCLVQISLYWIESTGYRECACYVRGITTEELENRSISNVREEDLLVFTPSIHPYYLPIARNTVVAGMMNHEGVCTRCDYWNIG